MSDLVAAIVVEISKKTWRREGAQAQIRARWYSKREDKIARLPISVTLYLGQSTKFSLDNSGRTRGL